MRSAINFPPFFSRDIDKVDDLMSEITEQQDIAQQISDAISKPVGFGDDVDEVAKKCTFLLGPDPTLKSIVGGTGGQAFAKHFFLPVG